MTSPIDPHAIAALRAIAPDEPNFLRELIDVFLADTPARLADMTRALEQSNAELLTRAAHSVKGSACNFGATLLVELAAELENIGRAAAWSDAAARLPAAREEFERVAAALQQLR
jgi:HPt (histidine-containing phosphotransfer) domain-containing protein